MVAVKWMNVGLEAWNDINGGGRDDVLQMFEKLAYDRDRVELKL